MGNVSEVDVFVNPHRERICIDNTLNPQTNGKSSTSTVAGFTIPFADDDAFEPLIVAEAVGYNLHDKDLPRGQAYTVEHIDGADLLRIRNTTATFTVGKSYDRHVQAYSRSHKASQYSDFTRIGLSRTHWAEQLAGVLHHLQKCKNG